jgi:phosphoesterase RecJ-like protein
MSMVHVFNNINELEVWMSVYYDDTIRKWRGSLRSRNIPINFIAEKYHGGGHKFAAGFTLDKKNDYKHLVKDLTKYLYQSKLKSIRPLWVKLKTQMQRYTTLIDMKTQSY